MLEIRNLCVSIGRDEIVAIEELNVPRGRRIGLVGESGSGKTMTAMSIVGLQPREAQVTGSIRYEGRELVGRSDPELTSVRGAAIGVIFQDPTKALNPVMRVGKQVAEAVRIHSDHSRAEIRERVLELLAEVHLPDAKQLVRRYPHQLSGGQRQRVMIAIAIACRPKLLIADEPTTALDVTVQGGILRLLKELSENHGMGLLFVSHDLGVVRSVSEDVAVMYGGQLVEVGPVDTVVNKPRHRYTEALIAANPGYAGSLGMKTLLGQSLKVIKGSVPPLGGFPSGCRFRGRCPHEIDTCAQEPPTTREGTDHHFKCWNPAVREGVLTNDSSC